MGDALFTLSAFETEALLLSLRVAVWAVLGSLPFAIGFAWLLSRKEFWGKSALNAVLHLPLVVPPVVVGYGLLVLFGRNGPLGKWLLDTFGVSVAFSWKGAAIAAAVVSFPLMLRAIKLSMDAVDERLEFVAHTLGASRWKVLRTVTIPLTMPGIVAGIALSFARCLGEFGATITFVANIPGETRTLPLALYTAINSPGAEMQAGRIVLISVVLALGALALSEIAAHRVTKAVHGI
ncbi:MAG: molybdate ABC transporter permease subunit [Alphaproteobacteria bacterium]|nr:MAG: molybdate ABC transporter permease subunit [Alphaproteobacteria bacterium]